MTSSYDYCHWLLLSCSFSYMYAYLRVFFFKNLWIPKKGRNRCKTHQFRAWLNIIGPQIAGRFTTMVPLVVLQLGTTTEPQLESCAFIWPLDPWDWTIYLHENHKNQPFMQVNIPVPWILWVHVLLIF